MAADERVEEGGGGWRGWDENYSNHKAPVLCFPHSAWRMHRPHTERDGEVDKKRRRELEEAQLTAWTCHRTHCRSTCCCWMKTQPLLLYSLQVDWYVSCRTTHRDEGCLQKKKMFLYDYLCWKWLQAERILSLGLTLWRGEIVCKLQENSKIKTGKLELKSERAAQQSLSRITHWTMTELQTRHGGDPRSPNMENVRKQTWTDRDLNLHLWPKKKSELNKCSDFISSSPVKVCF